MEGFRGPPLPGGGGTQPKDPGPSSLTFQNQKNIGQVGGEGEGGRKPEARLSHVFSAWLEECMAKTWYFCCATGTLTVALSADIETPLLQITVPEKIETNIKDGNETETQVIKKPDFWKMMGVNLYSISGPHQRIPT